MAYSGSTEASSVSNPPRLLVGRFAGLPGTTGLSTSNPNQASQGGNLWYYNSTNSTTDLNTSTFFSDGWYLGMRAGDIVMAVSFTSAGSSVQLAIMPVVTASTNGCGFTTGGTITSTFG
ncbi:MAG: hypothetical protein ACYC36_03525 [Bellilinea sp.]